MKGKNMNFKIGQKIKVRGLDENCYPVVEVREIDELLSKKEIKKYNGRYNVVTKSKDGILVLGHTDEFIE